VWETHVTKSKFEGNIIHKLKWSKAHLISQILHRKSLLNQAVERRIEGRIDMTGGRWRMCKQLPWIENITTRSHAVKNWFRRSLWTCRKTDCLVEDNELLSANYRRLTTILMLVVFFYVRVLSTSLTHSMVTHSTNITVTFYIKYNFFLNLLKKFYVCRTITTIMWKVVVGLKISFF
jgi:hypothetical protein